MRAAVPFIRNGNSVRPNCYLVWANMKSRCSNPKVPNYRFYGGRGIRVCGRWQSFANFHADMGDRPLGMSLDRIDNAGDYCPENCRWASSEDQHTNTRQNHNITINGRTLTVGQWARESGINKSTLQSRLDRGWTADKLLKATP